MFGGGNAAVNMLAKVLRHSSGSQEKELEKGRQNNSQSEVKHRVQTVPPPSLTKSVTTLKKNAQSGGKAANTKRLSYRKSKSSSDSPRQPCESQSFQCLTPGRVSPDMDQPAVVSVEKRPSLTERELTPIVLNQLESTRKQKQEWKKTRRGSNKEEVVKKEPDVVSDSGAESCSEEASKRTAQLFMTGIQTALTENFDEVQVSTKDGSQDIVTEVDNVLAKLMASLQKGDVEMPGIQGNIIPLITSLQATLRAKQSTQQQQLTTPQQQLSSPQKQLSTSQQQLSTPQQQLSTPQQQLSTPQQQLSTPQEQLSTLQQQLSNPQQQLSTPQQQLITPQQQLISLSQQLSTPPQQLSTHQQQPSKIQDERADQLKNLPSIEINRAQIPDCVEHVQSPELHHKLAQTFEHDHPPKQQHVKGSKIPWKIQANRKRKLKHFTIGLTREEFANIQETFRNRPVQFPGLQSAAPYSLSRNKSEGHIIRGTEVQENEAAEDEAGYLSDICDYNLQNYPPAAEDKEAGVVHGKLFIPMSSDTEASPLIRVRSSKLAKSRLGEDEEVVGCEFDYDESSVQTGILQIAKPGKKVKHSDEEDSQLSRQSSVEDNKVDGGGRRKSSGGKSSSIKSRIQMRKLIKEANKHEIPSGTLSDQDPDNDRESVEEKQDSESTLDHEIFNSKKLEISTPSYKMSELTPESMRRMKDWNSRFSNLKSSFDASSDKEEELLLSPLQSRRGKPQFETDTEERGRGRFKEKVPATKRAQSAHCTLRTPATTNHPNQSTASERAQSKDDKNKNNAIIANNATRRNFERISKEKSPSARRTEDTDDEYIQYLNSVDRYRQSNPNPKPFRPTTARPDAIANPGRKMSDGQNTLKQPQAKSKQTTPVRDPEIGIRVSKSVPKEVSKHKTLVKEESQAEILGLVRTNKETGAVEKTNDMDYEDYMNIINRVRKTKEFTRVRTEQARLASMYAQERKRQEEIQLEEERLRLERERFDEEKRRSFSLPTPEVPVYTQRLSEENVEKGQLDNKEQELGQQKVSPKASLYDPVAIATKPGVQERGEGNRKEQEEKAEQLRLQHVREQQIRQQKLREEQVLAEQKKLEQLREEQVRQDQEREEIRSLEIERLKQIQEDQQRLEEERNRQQQQIRMEQLKLEEEKKKQEQLQRDRQEQYQKQEEEMMAKAKAVETKKLEMERLKIEQLRNSSMSPHEKLIHERLRQQERLREEQLLEEAQIRQEKLSLIRQEETLLMRQEEMLRQIQEEKMKLLKQEDLIRNRQQDRLKQVRAEKALLEKQEQMLKLREEQLLQERIRQEKLREEAFNLKKQEEEIRRRQEEITKELLKGEMSLQGVDDVMVCQAREGQVFQGRKPQFPERVLDCSLVDVQQLNTSDWSSSDAESMRPYRNSMKDVPTYMEANDNYDSNPFYVLNEGAEEQKNEEFSGSSEEEDTMEEDCYECKVEVKQQNTQVPTSVRTIETATLPGWAPVTPYLNMSKHLPITTQEEISAIFTESKSQGSLYKTAGIVTSPESVMTSTNMITTPDSSISLHSQMSNNEMDLSSCPASPIPPIPPLPKDSKDLMSDHFQTVQPDVPPRDDSFNITAVYSTDPQSIFTEQAITSQAPGQRRSLIVPSSISIPSYNMQDPQLSPRLGGPGSAFRPYASSENLYDASLFPSSKPPVSISNGHSTQKINKRHSTSSIKQHKINESDDNFFKPRAKHLRAPIMSTTDTEPEMKEFNLGPIGGDKKGKKYQKNVYSTSETEEEYQAYLKIKPKWHGKGGHKDSWDPLQIASPPQIVQRPVGVVQKPKPQAKPSVKIERGVEYTGAFAANDYDKNFREAFINSQMHAEIDASAGYIPERIDKIQKSDTVVELRNNNSLVPPNERIQKSTSVIEVIPANLKLASGSPRNYQGSHLREPFNHSIENNYNQDKNVPVYSNQEPVNQTFPINTMLQIPQVYSPPDSEDQATPQAPRRQFLPNQASFESTNSFSETDDGTENLAPQLKSNKEDPETKKKKEIHKNLMSEALKKVELRNNQKKNFSQLSRTNPTIAALDIVTRKELKLEELEIKQEQEMLRNRNRSGSSNIDDSNKKNLGGVNQNVLQSFRQQSIHKGTSSNQNGASREASIQAKKAGTPAKPDLMPKPGELVTPQQGNSSDTLEPVVVLRKQPRILDQKELSARQSSEKLRTEGKSTPILDIHHRIKSPENKSVTYENKINEKSEIIENKGKNLSNDLEEGEQEKTINNFGAKNVLKKTLSEKESNIVRANEKISAAQQKILNTEQKLSIKQNLQGVVQVKPKQIDPTRGVTVARPLNENTSSSIDESNNNIASVKKAAEKYENKSYQSDTSPNINSHLRLRSKSIGSNRKDLFEESTEPNATKANLPWAVKSPPVLRKRDAQRNKGYVLQMSKSSDSITAAKLLAKARADNYNATGLRINQNLSKSIEKQIDVYSKTKEEIRLILSLAKSGSVNDRVELFTNMVNARPEKSDPEAKAEIIRREIEDARAQIHDTVSDTEIEFQDPVESKVKPLKIPMKPKLLDKPDNSKSGVGLRINQGSAGDARKERRQSIDELPCVKSKISNYLCATEESNKAATALGDTKPMKPILVNKNAEYLDRGKERSRSPKKKTPKLVSNHFLTPEQNFQIYAQSATDLSATEDESETYHRKKSIPCQLSSQDPGPNLLSVPLKEQAEVKPGIMKSKSFAATGQFEGTIENSLVTHKKQTMMAFFTPSEQKPKSILKNKPKRRNSVSSLTDEVLAEEDLVDVDAEFESLLNSTFERESKMNSNLRSTNAGFQSGKGKGIGSAGSQARAMQHSVLQGNYASNDPKLNSKLHKSKSFSASAYNESDPLAQSEMLQINQSIKDGFDPIAALPSSQNRHQRRVQGGTPPSQHSPSPTQSEYDTADPWDES